MFQTPAHLERFNEAKCKDLPTYLYTDMLHEDSKAATQSIWIYFFGNMAARPLENWHTQGVTGLF